MIKLGEDEGRLERPLTMAVAEASWSQLAKSVRHISDLFLSSVQRIDYRTADYVSFRRFLFDQLSAVQVAIDELDVRILGGNLASLLAVAGKTCYVVFGMLLDNCIEGIAANVAGAACPEVDWLARLRDEDVITCSDGGGKTYAKILVILTRSHVLRIVFGYNVNMNLILAQYLTVQDLVKSPWRVRKAATVASCKHPWMLAASMHHTPLPLPPTPLEDRHVQYGTVPSMQIHYT